ncbi:MAG TPA: 23S rRNA (uracil(1939)-C(5))-methyltransferase RlmD [Pseudomonadales bacterium]|nr:23S rRNA (uracil(1939)-C(5))-methyltransferase RlmD [Pseudomonadales bacterium]
MNRDPVTIDVVDLHADGYGVAGDGKFGIFGALPGERVVAAPFTRRKRKTFARTLEVELASADRVNPICSSAGLCGGCSLQHMSPQAQLMRKQKTLLDALGDCRPRDVMSPLMGPVSGYRTKARLGVKLVEKKGKVLVGFREKMSPYIAEIESCEVLAEPVGELIPGLSSLIASLDARSRIPQIEVAIGDDRAALIFRHLDPLTDADMARFWTFADETGLHVYLQAGGPDSTLLAFPKDAEPCLHYSLPDQGLTYKFHPLDFTQINQAINRKLVNRVLELISPASTDRIADLFCGIGNFTLPLAQVAASVVGVEGVPTAVERARENAVRNGIENCLFSVADLFASDLDFDLSDTNKVLLDPPRSGAAAVCEKLASGNVERVVYVSCNPVTLARDAKSLVEKGFALETTGVVDMFPHTTHVESIACFLR